MKISVIIENDVCTPNHQDVNSEHGLCLHVELNNTKILVDVGKSDLFIHNSKKMGIDLTDVDYLIISHGHYDHGGGLKHFLNINKKAKIFMHKSAINKYYTKILGLIPFYIGLDRELINNNSDRIHFIEKDKVVTENITLLEKFQSNFPLPSGNKSLYEKRDKKLVNDTFQHEIGVLLTEKDKTVLFTSCSHSGVINILEKSNEVLGGERIDAVFGGFHTHNPVTKKNESNEYLNALASEMEKSNSIFYTGHCTGEKNFRYLKSKLGNRVQSMNAGEVMEI